MWLVSGRPATSSPLSAHSLSDSSCESSASVSSFVAALYLLMAGPAAAALFPYRAAAAELRLIAVARLSRYRDSIPDISLGHNRVSLSGPRLVVSIICCRQVGLRRIVTGICVISSATVDVYFPIYRSTPNHCLLKSLHRYYTVYRLALGIVTPDLVV